MIRQHVEALATPIEWHEASVEALARWSETEVLEPFGLNLGSYGSARMFWRDRHLQRNWAWRSPLVPGLFFGLEKLPTALAHLATKNGVSLKKICDLNEEHVQSILLASCNLIRELSPELFSSVRMFLRSLHVLESPGRGYDVSFSLPCLPNSVFLSIPQPSEHDTTSRLTEAIVHEVLHLQLSLVERICPLVRNDAEQEFAYSPWRDERRPLGGLIHGLFVFRGLELLWKRVARNHLVSIFNFAKNRVEEIRRQCALVEPLEYRSLTSFGQKIFLRLVEA
ncbi:MAG: hypothetical protein F4X19_14940 [Acidobacteria bacterium]|nr:hypothetical protein [Acidobacteriota bacterium]